MVLGDYIQGGAKEAARRAEKAFKELQALYEATAGAKPFMLPKELNAPVNFQGAGLEITPVDYPLVIQSGSGSRTISVRSPLTWTLTYSGFAPTRLPELLKTRLRPDNELTQFVLSSVLLHVVQSNSPGLLQAFAALHFPISTATVPEFGPLPLTRISAAITTTRPSDEVILETAELTGVDAFEEVVKVEELAQLKDPLKERVMELARQHVPQLV
jgi:hypothetical protein